LTATLFGAPNLAWQGEPINAGSQKGRAMLLALCLQPAGFSRAELAELLWGYGRVQNVRQELTALRALPGADQWLETQDQVRANAISDVAAFEAACAAARYDEAVVLYRAPLLEGLTVARAPAFMDWLEIERQRLEDLLRHALRQQANALENTARYAPALVLLDRLISFDPLDETSYRSAMRLSYKLGDLNAALAYFAACRRTLLAEFGTEPLSETIELHDRIAAEHEHAQDARDPGARVALHGTAGAVAALSGIALRLAQALALPGRTLPVDLLAHVIEAAPREVAATFEELAARGLLAGQQLSAAAVDAVRAATPQSIGLHLHARAAQALIDAAADPGEIALHLLAAHNPSVASDWLLAAARAAEADLDTAAAQTWLFRALWACGDGRQRIELLLHLERLTTQTGDAALREHVLHALEEEAFVLQDDLILIETRIRRAMQLVQTGRARTALELAEETARCARRLERPDLLARVNHLIGAAAFHSGDLERAAEAFSDVAVHGAPAEQLAARNNLGALAGIRGDFDEALQHHEQALTIARELGQRPVIAGILNNLGATSERTARYEKAARSFEEAARLFAAVDDPQGGATAWANAADVLLKQGRYRHCGEALHEARQLSAALTAPALTCRIELLAGLLQQNKADYPAALALLGSALATATEMQNERLSAIIRFNLEMAHLHAEPGRSWNDALAALEALEEMNLNDVLPWAYAELGQLSTTADDARSWADRLTQYDANPHIRLLLLLSEQKACRMDGDSTIVPGLAELAAQLRVAESGIAEELLAAV
jgi:DNA-binding SARP family transcriptional activator